MSSRTDVGVSEWALVVAAPWGLAVLEVFHPHLHDPLQLDVRTWLVVHYLQIALFPLAAFSVVALIRGSTGIAPALCRVAMFVFAVSYIAFDTAAGVVTGILVDAARQSGHPENWREAIDAVWKHRIVGGVGVESAPLLALAGAIALSVGTVTAAIALKRRGRPWAPVILLGLSGFGIGVFQTHAWPGGPVTFGLLGIAGAWLLPLSDRAQSSGAA
jgi:hypothetical protein